MAVPNCEGTTTPEVVPNSSWFRMRNMLRRTWGQVRWKIAAIIAFTV